MNEKEFARYILDIMRKDKTVETWYKNFIQGTDFAETETRIANAIENKELTPQQAIQLSVFIGLTTEVK